MKLKVWVLTFASNDYDQHGEYFKAVFIEKPTRSELLKVLYGGDGDNSSYNANNHKQVSHILNGGGRTDKLEHSWYILAEKEVGTDYEGFGLV